MFDVNNIIQQIMNYEVVTFDVFDTLIKRDVCSYKNFVEYMNIEYKKITGKKLPVWFFRERVHSTKVVARKTPGVDANLDSIYDVLHVKDKDVIKKIEYDLEIKFAVANPFIYEVYQYCKKSGKKIYAISDMYLPESCIRKMLEKCGYEIETIYVSQQYNCSKVSSKLFEEFLREQNLEASQVVHIGDNKEADVVGANRIGIEAVHIPVYNDLPRYINKKRDLYRKILYKFINNRLAYCDTILEKTGYETIGPILYGFTCWLHDNIEKNGIDKVFFLSRDGYLLKKAYELLYGGEKIETNYLCISSNSVKEAYNDNKNQKELLCKYLKQNKFLGKVAIVDIGWSGNMHRMLYEITSDFAEVMGFYFGTYCDFEKNVKDGISGGYLNLNKINMSKVYMSAGFIEILFSDTYMGSTEKYIVDGYDIKPVCSKYLNGKKIRELQLGAIKFMEDWHNSEYNDFKYANNKLIDILLKLAINPTKEDVKELENECIGGVDGNTLLVGEEEKYTLSQTMNFLKDLRNVPWKGGMLTKHIPFSIVNKLYELINPLFIIRKI